MSTSTGMDHIETCFSFHLLSHTHTHTVTLFSFIVMIAFPFIIDLSAHCFFLAQHIKNQKITIEISCLGEILAFIVYCYGVLVVLKGTEGQQPTLNKAQQ